MDMRGDLQPEITYSGCLLKPPLAGEAYCGGPTTGRTALLQYVMFVFDVDRPFGVYDRCAVIAEKYILSAAVELCCVNKDRMYVFNSSRLVCPSSYRPARILQTYCK